MAEKLCQPRLFNETLGVERLQFMRAGLVYVIFVLLSVHHVYGEGAVIDPKIDEWIDSQIAAKSTHFRQSLHKAYQHSQVQKNINVRDGGDEAGSVFLSKMNANLNLDDMHSSESLDAWIDAQVETALHPHRHAKRLKPDQVDDLGEVWLQDALSRDDEEGDEEDQGLDQGVESLIARDFAKGMFFARRHGESRTIEKKRTRSSPAWGV